MNDKKPRLYHFTKSFETLSHYIIPGGFWPQYSLEDFSWVQHGKPLFLAFPCACFTELPPDKCAMHRDDYGSYVIGFREDWNAIRSLQPLKYVNEEEGRSLLNSAHCRALTKCSHVDTSNGMFHFPPTKLQPEDFDGVWDILPYLKEHLGHTLQRLPTPRGSRSHVWMTKYLRDEREWRFIPKEFRDALFSVMDFDARTMGALAEMSNVTHDAHLTFKLADVAIIVVITDKERKRLAADYPELAEKIKVWDELPSPGDQEED